MTPAITTLLAALLALGCGTTSSPQDTPARAAPAPDRTGLPPDSTTPSPPLAAQDAAGSPAPAPDAPPRPPAPPAILSPETLSWGTVGLAPSGSQPAWVAGFVRLDALRPLPGLRLERIRILDAGGDVVAQTVAEHEIRVASPRNLPGDLSAYGTDPLQGDIPAGAHLRLRLYGRLDRSFDDLCPRLCNPTHGERFEAVLRTAAGDELRVEGPLSAPWPTA